MLLEQLINDSSFDINEYEGFVYLITNIITGEKYIGKKSFHSRTNKKLGKKEIKNLPITRGRKASTKKVIKESDWKEYYSSSLRLKEDVNKYGKQNFIREVIKLCKTKKELSYYETKYLFIYGVIEPNSQFINDSILGKFYRKDLS